MPDYKRLNENNNIYDERGTDIIVPEKINDEELDLLDSDDNEDNLDHDKQSSEQSITMTTCRTPTPFYTPCCYWEMPFVAHCSKNSDLPFFEANELHNCNCHHYTLKICLLRQLKKTEVIGPKKWYFWKY